MSLCSWLGRAAIGSVADTIGPLNTFVLLWLWSAMCQFALWYTAKSYSAIFAFVILWGLVAPGYFTLLPQIIIRIFGPENLASNSGLILFMISIGNIGAGPIGGRIFDSTPDGTWKWVIVFGGLTQFIGGLTAFWGESSFTRANPSAVQSCTSFPCKSLIIMSSPFKLAAVSLATAPTHPLHFAKR